MYRNATLSLGLLLAGSPCFDSTAAAAQDSKLDSRMGIDDNFQALDEARTVRGFRAYGGTWQVENGVLHAPAGPGPKLVADEPQFARGEVGVEVLLPDAAQGNAGLIVKLSDPGVGADSFAGYEVALDAAAGHSRLGRHRQNFKPIQDVPCPVPVNRWIALVIRMSETTLEIVVDGKSMLVYEDRVYPLIGGGVAFRSWQREARYRNFWISTADTRKPIALEPAGIATEICDPWMPVCRGSARGEFTIVDGPDPKRRAQRIAFLGGEGEVGFEHRGPEGRSLAWLAGRRYQGWLWVRCDRPTELLLAAESVDGQALAATRSSVAGGDWQTVPFTLIPERGDDAGRFVIKLAAPGSVWVARVLVQPGDWAWPETLATETLPPIAMVVRHPLSAPPAAGQDLWAARPRSPGCSIRIVDPSRPEQSRSIFSDPDGCSTACRGTAAIGGTASATATRTSGLRPRRCGRFPQRGSAGARQLLCRVPPRRRSGGWM